MKTLHKSYIFSFLCSIVIVTVGHAQVAEDALLISRTAPTGTARMLGLGGGGVSLGGDLSSAYINPAGLGFYNRSQVVLSPHFKNAKTNSNFLNSTSETFDNQFNISNFGIVFNNTKDDIVPADYRGGSFAISYNQTNTYNISYGFGGENAFSLLDEFALQANGIDVAVFDQSIDDETYPFYPDAAYANYLINPYPDNSTSYAASIPPGAIAVQEGLIEEQGRQSEWDFSYGGNYKDKLYFGASIGFKNFTYEKNTSFSEQYMYPEEFTQGGSNYPFKPFDDSPLTIESVDNVRLDETLNIDGSGVNASIGLIYRPVNELTIGLAYKTPTIYSMTEEYSFVLNSQTVGIREEVDSEPQTFNQPVVGTVNFSEYTLSTPSKVSGGFSYFFQKYGFITADVEYMNYAANRFGSNEFNTGTLNTEIDEVMKSVINYKLGGEFRYDMFRLRLGYALYADPTRYAGDQLDRDRVVLSGGVGFHTPTFFADLAVVNTQYNTDFFPYQGAQNFPTADIPNSEDNITNVVLSVGFNF